MQVVRARRRVPKGWVIALALLAVLGAAWGLFMAKTRPVVLSMSEARMRELAATAMNQAVRETMCTDVNYYDLIDVKQDDKGNVSMVQSNTVRMNELGAQCAARAQNKLNELAARRIDIPLGAALGWELLQGAGPNISVKIVPVGSVLTEFKTEFENAGINQTRFKVYMDLHAQVDLVIPTGARTVDIITHVPVAETIIVGTVPDYYVNVDDQNKMLDLIPESAK
nr:sporulation protein YunB [Maliibacterium massiliense]